MYTHVNMYIYTLCTFIHIISYLYTYINLLYIILPDKKASPFPFCPWPDLGSNDLWETWIFPGLFLEHLEVSMKNPSFPSGKLTWNPKKNKMILGFSRSFSGVYFFCASTFDLIFFVQAGFCWCLFSTQEHQRKMLFHECVLEECVKNIPVSASMDSQHLGFASMDSHLSTATNLPDPFCLGVKKTKTCLRSVEISGLIATMLFWSWETSGAWSGKQGWRLDLPPTPPRIRMLVMTPVMTSETISKWWIFLNIWDPMG